MKGYAWIFEFSSARYSNVATNSHVREKAQNTNSYLGTKKVNTKKKEKRFAIIYNKVTL